MRSTVLCYFLCFLSLGLIALVTTIDPTPDALRAAVVWSAAVGGMASIAAALGIVVERPGIPRIVMVAAALSCLPMGPIPLARAHLDAAVLCGMMAGVLIAFGGIGTLLASLDALSESSMRRAEARRTRAPRR